MWCSDMKCLHRKVGECKVLSGANNAHDKDFIDNCTCRECGVIGCTESGDENNRLGACVREKHEHNNLS